jgi:hypothetical protein
MDKLGPRVRVRAATPLDGFRALVVFDNDSQREIDLAPFLHGPVFEPIRNDPASFRSMKVASGTIAWDNGADIDPDVLYYGLKPAWMERPENAGGFGEGARSAGV